MAAKSSMMIQFPRGGIIPADVLKSDKDRDCGPGEPVKVPKAYADHLIERRIAVAAEEATKAKMKSAPPKKENTDPHAELKAKITEAEKALVEAETEEAKADAQKFLDTANQALSDAAASS